MGWLLALLGCAPPDPLGPVFSFNFELLAYGHFEASDRNLDDALLARALDSPAMRDLVGLGVAGNRLGPASGRRIAAHPRTAGLRELSIGSNVGFGGEGLRALASAPFLATLEELDVSNVGADGDAFTALAGARSLAVLDASNNPLGDEVVPTLLALPSLRWLSLRSTRISVAGLRALLAHPGLAVLELDGTPLGAGAQASSASARPADAARPAGPPPEAAPDAAAPGAPTAVVGPRKTLSLADTGLTLGELGWLFESGMPLGSLDVGGNPLGDAGADALARAAWLGDLEALGADRIGASPESLARLRAAWGDRRGLTVGE